MIELIKLKFKLFKAFAKKNPCKNLFIFFSIKQFLFYLTLINNETLTLNELAIKTAFMITFTAIFCYLLSFVIRFLIYCITIYNERSIAKEIAIEEAEQIEKNNK